MPYQAIYKDIAYTPEASFGTSIAASTRVHIKSSSLGLNQTKELVEDTVSSSKGRDRMIRRRNVIEGDIEGFGSPRGLHFALQLVNGAYGTTSAVGSSAMLITYNQNTSGSMLTYTVNHDRNTTQEAFAGVYANSMELSASDDLLEWTLSGGARTRGNGSAIADNAIGETVHGFLFSDFTVTIHAGSTYGANTVTHKVSEWSAKYENGVEPTHLSGSANIDRIDPKIPMVSGKFKIFHEGSSWVDATYGASEFYIRFDGVLPSQGGLIAGVTPHTFRLDIPRTQLTTNVRNYEQNEFAVEEIEFVGMMDLSPVGTSALWRPSMTVPLTF